MLWHKRSLVINCPEYLFIRKVKGVVKSVKNASKCSRTGGISASGKGRLKGVRQQHCQQLPWLPKVSFWLEGVFLHDVYVPGEHPELRSSLMDHGRFSPWSWCPDMQQFQCLPSFQPCRISYPWNEDLAGHWASNASAMGRGNPGAAVDAFGV